MENDNEIQIAINGYNQFLIGTPAKVKELIGQNKAKRDLFRSEAKKAWSEPLTKQWMLWYYWPLDHNPHAEPKGKITEKQKTKAAFGILAFLRDSISNKSKEERLLPPTYCGMLENHEDLVYVMQQTLRQSKGVPIFKTIDSSFPVQNQARIEEALATVKANLPLVTDMETQPAFVNEQPKINISNTDLYTLKSILSAIEEWKRVADKNGPESKDAKQFGSKAVELLFRHIKLLDDFQLRFRASIMTGKTLYDLTEKVNSVNPTARQFSYFYDYQVCCQDNFIDDLKRWIKEAGTKPSETKQDAAPTNIFNIKNFQGVMGDVHQPENLQIGNNASISKQTVKVTTTEKRHNNWPIIVLIITTLVTIAGWFFVPYINSRIKPDVNPPIRIQALPLPQKPHRSSVKPMHILSEPVISKQQLIGIPELINEPNKDGRETNDSNK